MNLSNRSNNVNESVTLKLNEKASLLAQQGKKIYNLTAGQLPFKPPGELVEKIGTQMNMLASFQYSPVKGVAALNEKFMQTIERKRNISLPRDQFDCMISCGAKHSVFNVLGALINPGDEVVLFSPYWVSYPEMIKIWQGEVKVLPGNHHGQYEPDLDKLEELITAKTKAVILNSPNNPAGIFYSKEWIEKFAAIIAKHEQVFLLSDEIYFDLSYYDPGPSYPYQSQSSLLKRTIIIDGVSKSFAGTGLRIGYTIADKQIIKAMSRLQSHSTSGATTLVQKGLLEFDWDREMATFLEPIMNHLRQNATLVHDKLSEYGLTAAWYQCNSAFYFMLDFSFSPYFKNNFAAGEDHAAKICEAILEETGVALVPSSDFGLANSARVSLVSETSLLTEALDQCFKFLAQK